MNNKEISKDILGDLYWKDGLSLSKIAEKYGLKSPNSIAYHMEKFGLPKRPSDRKNYPKKQFSGNLSEKAYLIGLRAGDISAQKKCKLITVCTTSTKPAQMQMFRDAFEKYSHVNEYAAKGGFTEKTRKINCYLHPSFEFLVEKPERIPVWVLNDESLFYSFLAGYCDSEASWIITEHKKYGGKWKDLVFSLGTCDKTLLEQINQRLKELGFNSHFYLVREKGIHYGIMCNFDLYRVMIMNHKDVVKLAETLLPFSRHEEKRNAKLHIINYEKTNAEKKLLKKKNLGTIEIPCFWCGHAKVWKNGFKKYKNIKHRRYKCPSCNKEFQEKLS